MEVENDIERAKSDLVHRSDFNVEDALKIFKYDGKNMVLNFFFDIFSTIDEIDLIIKRNDSRCNGELSYANFFELVAPADREYRRKLEGRFPSSYIPKYNKADVFLTTTKLYFQKLLNLILRSEAN